MHEPIRSPWWTYSAPVLLIAIACIQFVRAQMLDLTPWKGGGFGMFSTTDTPSARYLKLYLITPDVEIPAELPERLQQHADKAMAEPLESRWDYLAQRLVRMRWVDRSEYRKVVLGQFTSSVPGAEPRVAQTVDSIDAQARHTMLDIRAVRVEMWKYDYQAETSQLVARRVLSVEKPVQARESRP